MTDPELPHGPANLTPSRKMVVGTIFLLVFVALVTLAGWFAIYVVSPGPPNSSETVTVTIPRGTSVRGIGDILAGEGVISHDIRFLLLAKISGYSSRLQAGEFRLHTGKRPGEVLKELAFAKPVEHAITVPEGLRASEIAEIFGALGWCDPDNFVRLVSDKPFMEKLGFGQLDSLEGYLFPDTYLLTRDIYGAENIIPIMVRRFAEVWNEVTAESKEQPDREKTVILASIVEKETGASEERPLIAGVFYNRMKLGMRLQSDPTVVYGSKRYAEAITRSDLQTPTPYNTYLITGLPAGPICNPGKYALEAALHPTSTPNLYFVSKNDGTHHFSKTLSEHNRAVEKYQRKNSSIKGK